MFKCVPINDIIAIVNLASIGGNKMNLSTFKILAVNFDI